MSRTVSFRASEELDEFLEEEAERRMTTKSTVAQMIVAEYAQQRQSEPEGEAEDVGSDDGEDTNSLPDTLEEHSDYWYEPNGEKHDYAVETPGMDRTRYYKTADGAAERIEKELSE